MNSNPLPIEEWDNIPNRLTLFRIALVPFVLVPLLAVKYGHFSFIQNYGGILSAFFFSLASLTDALDGYLARKHNQITLVGSFLDPIADKFLVVSALICLSGLGRISILVVIVLVLRELYITSLRLLALQLHIEVKVNFLGKIKTIIQMCGIILVMVEVPLKGINAGLIGEVLLVLAAVFALISSFTYTRDTWAKLKFKKGSSKIL